MKLVLTYSTGDGCTFSCDETYPFEYESAEKAYCDLMDMVKAYEVAMTDRYVKDEVIFAGMRLSLDDFKGDSDLNIQTLEEWFETHKQNLAPK